MGLCTTYGVGQYAASESHSAGWDHDYKAATGGRGIVWAHSAGASFSLEPWIASNNCLPLLGALASLGLSVMSGDFGGNSTWGNPTAQARIADGWTWIKSQYGAKTDRVILAGVSMGGLNMLNFARANPTLVKAIMLFYPCVALQAQFNGTGGAANNSAGITAAYGGTPTWATYDPSNGTNPTAYTGVPIYMGYSDSDTVVGSANQSAFITAVGGSTLTSRVYTGAGHSDMTKINVNDVVTWVSAYL